MANTFADMQCTSYVTSVIYDDHDADFVLDAMY